MKNLFYLSLFILLGLNSQVSAQYKGRHFVSGSNSINFNTRNYKAVEGTQSTGQLNFDLSVGKFVTENRTTGWTLGGGLAIFKSTKDISDSYLWKDKANGISGYHVGIGKFWQYYKHLNEHWGLFGGPDIGATVGVRDQYDLLESNEYSHTRSTRFVLGLSLRGGAYFKLSENYWLNATVAFINPINLSFEKKKEQAYRTNSPDMVGESEISEFRYELSPILSLPAVGLGITYFVR